MPTYQYVCTDCGEDIEVVQKFSDDPLTTHDACGGKLRKVFSPVGIVFKGSGFYRTDSRGGSSVTSPASGDKAPANGNGSDSKTSESKSEKSEKKDSPKSGTTSSTAKVA